mgnify:CR=1 FL=1
MKRMIALLPPLLAGLWCVFMIAGWASPVMAGSWREGTPMTTARALGGAALIGEDIYVIGGTGTTGSKAVVESYDGIGDIWRVQNALPDGMQNFGVAAIDGRLFVAGGYASGQPNVAQSSMWTLQPPENVWTEGPKMPSPRTGHGAVAVDGKLYVIGGKGPDADRVLIYDPAEERWTTGPAAMPQARAQLAVVAVAGKIYAIGGRGADGAASARVDIYDTATRQWSRGADLPKPRQGHVAAVIGGRIHVTGGENHSPPQTFADHFALDAGANRWRTEAAMPTPRHGAVAVAVGGKLIVIGGATGAGVFTVFTESDLVEIYTPDVP